MRVTLFDFQKDALGKLRDALVSARKSVSPDNQQVVAFSAATGSGKTIMMTALFEAILDEPDDQLAWPLDWVPQPDAVICLVTASPIPRKHGKAERLDETPRSWLHQPTTKRSSTRPRVCAQFRSDWSNH